MRALALLLALAACGGAADGTTPAAVEQPDEPLGAKHAPGAPAPVPEAPAANPSPQEEEAALMTAAKAYVAANVAQDLQYTVELKAREGDFALLFVLPASPDQDTALVFMKKDKGTWTGLDLGTGIECAEHVGAGMPQSLCDSAGL
ncbi:MAG TPA: hypothetical protein VMZ28_30080 [Kofleriaceae bacterium]|nr:hypothetical protein [Kofleriaceae bacterium]